MSEPATRFVVGAREGGKRLDHFLHERIPGLSRTRIQRAIRERVSLSWSANAAAATPVRPGGVVSIGYTPLAETPLEIPIPVLVHGGGWIAVDKPAGIPVHPVNTIRENTLIRMLRRQERDEALRLTHRLDRETSGALLVARDASAARALAGAFLRGEVHKEYLARVSGEVCGPSGRITLPIGKAEDSPIWVKRAAGSGQAAVTDWIVERRDPGSTLLRVLPGTGRRHQIRVHLAAIGHPVLGDLLYGRPAADYLRLVAGAGDARASASGGPRRQLLHCARLAFRDPDTARLAVVEAPLPPDFAP